MKESKESSAYFKTRFSVNQQRDAIWVNITKYLQRYVPTNSAVLDLGAGYCSFINNIKAKEKHAVDTFPDMKRYAAKGVVCYNTRSTNLSSLKTNHFDVVFASNLFEHLTESDMTKTISGVRKLLKKGGKLIIIQPNFKYSYADYYDDYTHKVPYTHVGLTDLLNAQGLKVIKCIPKFLPFSMKSKLSLFHFLIPLYLRLPYRPLAKQMFIVAEK